MITHDPVWGWGFQSHTADGELAWHTGYLTKRAARKAQKRAHMSVNRNQLKETTS